MQTDRHPCVSPAARMLYEELSRPSIAHRVALEKRRLLPVLNELRAAGVAVVIPGGHVFASTYIEEIHRCLCSAAPVGSRDVATRFDLTHGQARALLDYLVDHGRLVRRGRIWSAADDADGQS